MKTIANNIIIKEPSEEKRSAGGIILQEKNSKNIPIEVVVEETGPETTYVSVGNHVLISPYTGTKFTVGEDSFRVLSEKDVLVIL